MNQTLNNLKAILTKHKDNMPVVAVAELLAEIDEAEAKLGCHAICYLDSPCEYQNEDINVVKVDEYYKEIRAKAIDEFAEKLGEEFAEQTSEIKVEGMKFDILTLDSAIEIIWDLAEQLKERE